MGKELQKWESRIGRRLKLRDLHVLSVVVQWGSMARAATQLAMLWRSSKLTHLCSPELTH